MKKILSLFVTLLLLSWTNSFLVAKAKLADFVSDDAVIFIQLDDWNEFSKKLESGPMGVFSESPAWDKMVEWMENELKEEESSGLLEEMKDFMIKWKDSFNGGMVLSIGNFDKMLPWKDGENDQTSLPPDMTILIETDSKKKDLISTLRWMKKEIVREGGKFSWEQSKVAGFQVHWIGTKPTKGRSEEIALILHDNVLFLLSGGEEHVRETLLLGAGDSSSESILEDPCYLDLFDEIGAGEARAFFNFKPLVSMLDDLSENLDAQIPENPFGIKTSGLLDALGLDSLDCLGVQIDLANARFSISSALFLSKYEGLFSLMEKDKKEAKLHDFLPPKLLSATSARYDFSQLWPRLEAIMNKISPQLLLLVNAQIQGFEDQIGVPFRKNVLGSLGDEIVTFSRLNSNWVENLGQFLSGKADDDDLDPDLLGEIVQSPTSDLYAISLGDPKLFDQALRATVDGATKGAELFDERKHRGTIIRSMKGLDQAGVSLSYAVVDKWLLVSMGEAQLLNQVIDRMQSEGKSLWDEKEVKWALREFPDGVSQVDYFDFEQLMDMLKPMLDELIKEQDVDLNLKASDIPDFPYFMLAWAKNVKRGMIAKAEFFPKAEARGD
jgi:hypothetical protein